MERFSIGGVIYIIIGVLVAMNQGYLTSLGTISQIVSALLAILLWPLALLGINLTVAF